MSLPDADLPALLLEIRYQAVSIAHDAWPELGAMTDEMLPDPMQPFALLPVCTGIACGAEPKALTRIAAVVVVAALALRIADDCADDDNPSALYHHAGMGRSINAAAALSTSALRALLQAPVPSLHHAALLDEYLHAFLQVCQGQDQGMRGLAHSLPDYCTIVQAKTVAAFEFSSLAGGRMAGGGETAIASCRECGIHLGWMIQILDDIEALWFPDDPRHLKNERQTFPILYGLSCDHPALPVLQKLSSAATYDTAQICALLDEMDVRRQLMTHALDHRDQALAALEPPLQPAGRATLQIWLDWLLRDGERLLGN